MSVLSFLYFVFTLLFALLVFAAKFSAWQTKTFRVFMSLLAYPTFLFSSLPVHQQCNTADSASRHLGDIVPGVLGRGIKVCQPLLYPAGPCLKPLTEAAHKTTCVKSPMYALKPCATHHNLPFGPLATFNHVFRELGYNLLRIKGHSCFGPQVKIVCYPTGCSRCQWVIGPFLYLTGPRAPTGKKKTGRGHKASGLATHASLYWAHVAMLSLPTRCTRPALALYPLPGQNSQGSVHGGPGV